LRRVLVIAGDRLEAGAFPDSLAVIRSGALQKAGIEEIDIASYPEGHPRIAPEKIDVALGDKIAAPVKVGMAGPASLPSLLRYAKRCGVRASLRGLMSGATAGLLGNVGPDRILEALGKPGDKPAGTLGDIAPHYFSFGGVVQTARYAHDKAAALAARRLAETHAMTNSN
jgi:methylenetetrahydrofolate reductase (NADPH)